MMFRLDSFIAIAQQSLLLPLKRNCSVTKQCQITPIRLTMDYGLSDKTKQPGPLCCGCVHQKEPVVAGEKRKKEKKNVILANFSVINFTELLASLI